MRALLWLTWLVSAAGCWQPRYFAPRESVTGTSPEGRAAAVYSLTGERGGRTQGEVRIWSDGAAARFAADDREVVDLRVAFELENHSEVALELEVEGLRLERLVVAGVATEALAPAEIVGSGRAAPQGTARVFEQVTPFAPAPASAPYWAGRWGGPGTGAYLGPAYGAWGLGWGAHWGLWGGVGWGYRCR